MPAILNPGWNELHLFGAELIPSLIFLPLKLLPVVLV
jgi:hypothetical protein